MNKGVLEARGVCVPERVPISTTVQIHRKERRSLGAGMSEMSAADIPVIPRRFSFRVDRDVWDKIG